MGRRLRKTVEGVMIGKVVRHYDHAGTFLQFRCRGTGEVLFQVREDDLFDVDGNRFATVDVPDEG